MPIKNKYGYMLYILRSYCSKLCFNCFTGTTTGNMIRNKEIKHFSVQASTALVQPLLLLN